MIRLPLLAGGVAIFFLARFLRRRRDRTTVRLRDGRQVTLLSSVALVSGSASDLLALEYSSPLADPDPSALRLEARSLVQTVAARAEFARCTSALVTLRPAGEDEGPAWEEHVFTFRRSDPGADWYPTDGLD